MTEKLYYQNSFLTNFTAAVTDCREEKNQWVITLNQTAFYPEGGGQPADHGTLDGVHVTDVREKDGEILHFCDGKVEIGKEVHGVVDWSMRFDFMQQHRG